MGRETITVEREREVEKEVTETEEVEKEVEKVKTVQCDTCHDEVLKEDVEEVESKFVNPHIDHEKMVDNVSQKSLLRLREHVKKQNVDAENVSEPDEDVTYHPQDALQALRGAIDEEDLQIESDGYTEKVCTSCRESESLNQQHQQKSTSQSEQEETKQDENQYVIEFHDRVLLTTFITSMIVLPLVLIFSPHIIFSFLAFGVFLSTFAGLTGTN